MQDYFKRFLIGHFLVLIAAIWISSYFGLVTAIVFIGLFEFLFYYLDTQYLPKRKSELANKLIEIFLAEPISEGVMKFKLNGNDLYAEIKVDFKEGLQLANIETVTFHIPRTQISKLSVRNKLNLIEDRINGILTYGIYQTSGSGLKLAKEELVKMI